MKSSLPVLDSKTSVEQNNAASLWTLDFIEKNICYNSILLIKFTKAKEGHSGVS